MVRISMSLAIGLFACTFLSGCVGMGCFPGSCGSCGATAYDCNNCNGYGRPLARGPLRRAGAALTCGSGCGEVYVDEWRNYPPNPCDPCESIGGCRPMLGAMRNLFGYRTHQCETCYGGDGAFLSALAPGCVTCGGCGTGCAESSCGVDAYYPSGGGGGGGCSSCGMANRVSPQSQQLASRPVPNGNVRTANAANGNPAYGNAARANPATGNRPVFRSTQSGGTVQSR